MSDEDARMLDELRAAVSNDGDRSEELIDMIMTGYDLTMSGTRIAEMIEESELVAVRSDEPGPRFWTGVVDDIRFDIEVGETSVVGSIEPAMPGRILLHQPEGLTSAELTASGSFEVARPTDAPFRLYFQPVEGDPIATSWILP
jgi:hypothetical protein